MDCVADMTYGIGIGQPDAEDAKVSQRTRKKTFKDLSWFSFCAFCETFASSASGNPHSRPSNSTA